MKKIFVFACFLPLSSTFAQTKGLSEYWQVRASCSETFTFSGGKNNYQYGIFELTRQAAVRKLAKDLDVENADQAAMMYIHTPTSNCSIKSGDNEERESFALLCEGHDDIQSESYVGFSDEYGNWLNSKSPITIAKKYGLIITKKYLNFSSYCDECFTLRQNATISLVSAGKQSVINFSQDDLDCLINVRISHNSF